MDLPFFKYLSLYILHIYMYMFCTLRLFLRAMGSNYKSYGGKCGCSKRLKKAPRVPQRGPGVAELEKILSDQKHDQMKPLCGPPPLPHCHPLRPAIDQTITAPPAPHQFDPRPESGLSFTQMMMMGEPLYVKRSDPRPMFHQNMNNPHQFPPAPNSGLRHFTDHSSSQRFYSKCAPAWPEEDKSALKWPGAEMPGHPHPFYAQQLGRPRMENGKSPMLAEQDKMMLRNILSLGPSSPIFVESESSEEHSSDKVHQTQIFGFNLQEKDLSMDDTKLSLHHNAARAEELSLDLSLKL